MEVLDKTLYQCLLVYYKSHMGWPGTELWPMARLHLETNSCFYVLQAWQPTSGVQYITFTKTNTILLHFPCVIPPPPQVCRWS